ncbi:MAG: hypothetical protein V7725_04235 [Porticoccus sp.]
MHRLGWLIFLLLLNGCAENPEKIQAAHTPFKLFDNYSCEELKKELTVVEFKIKELYLKLNHEYERDKDEATWGILFFPFTLLLLEGKHSPLANEYAHLLGMREAINRGAFAKSCSWFTTSKN